MDLKKVRINPELTTDPFNKRGQVGIIKEQTEDESLVRFQDGTLGRYDNDAFVPIITEEQLKTKLLISFMYNHFENPYQAFNDVMSEFTEMLDDTWPYTLHRDMLKKGTYGTFETACRKLAKSITIRQ